MLGQSLRPQLTRALNTYQRQSSDDRAELLLLPSAEQTGYGSRQHPGKSAHQAAAAVLTARIRSLEDRRSRPEGAARAGGAVCQPQEGALLLSESGTAEPCRPDYLLLCRQLESLQQSDNHALPLLANTSALLKAALPLVNWAGFYLLEGQKLVLGPFQGKVACIHIDLNQGVCGRAAREGQLLNVADVQTFPGHIACDADSRSELVLPIFKQDRVVAVLDLDSPRRNRFTEADEAGLTALVRQLEKDLII
ncbi:GAF domain-containing protein [Oscillospiraceae bacterium HV4-5-C5C]|nr:GAF domain-containing protein [Oscillospiraceae bacterium HV4-5-C5C]